MSRTRCSVEADTLKVESYSSSSENVSNESPRRRHVWGISSVKGQPVEAEESKRPPRVSLAVGAPTCLPSWSVSFTQQLRAFWKATITVSNSCSIFRFRKEILFCPKSKVFFVVAQEKSQQESVGRLRCRPLFTPAHLHERPIQLSRPLVEGASAKVVTHE